MPPSFGIAVLVLGGVLLLIAVVGGRFKLFGAEVTGEAGKGGRILAGAIGVLLILVALGSPQATPEFAQASGTSPAPNEGPTAIAASLATGTEANQRKESYPPSVRSKWLRECLDAGKSISQCQCFLEQFESRYSVTEYAALLVQIQTGDIPADYKAVREEIDTACADK